MRPCVHDEQPSGRDDEFVRSALRTGWCQVFVFVTPVRLRESMAAGSAENVVLDALALSFGDPSWALHSIPRRRRPSSISLYRAVVFASAFA